MYYVYSYTSDNYPSPTEASMKPFPITVQMLSYIYYAKNAPINCLCFPTVFASGSSTLVGCFL